MRCLHVISGDINGGASSSGVFLHNAMVSSGAISALYDCRSQSVVHGRVTNNIDGDVTVSSKLSSFYDRNISKSKNDKFSFAILQNSKRLEKLVDRFDVLLVHYFANSSIGIKSFLKCALKKRVIFIVRDHRLLTGGCHYPILCDYRQTDCVKCERSFSPKFLRQRQLKYAKCLVASPNVKIAVLNEYDRREILKVFRCDPDRVNIITNCVDPIFHNITHSDDVVREYDFLIGAVNPNDAYKGGDRIESILAVLKTRWPKCSIASFGKPLGHALIDKEFGVIEPSALLQLYRRCKYFIVPSRIETFGKTVVESALCGMAPIVYSGSRGPESIVANIEHGHILTDVNDLKKVKIDEWTLPSLSSQNRLFNYHVETTVHEIQDIFLKW